jgi:hypothetical protein
MVTACPTEFSSFHISDFRFHVSHSCTHRCDVAKMNDLFSEVEQVIKLFNAIKSK